MSAFSAMSPLPTLPRKPDRIGAALAMLIGLAGSAAGQDSRQDHVLWRNARGQVNSLAGIVSENSLTAVVVEANNSPRKLDPLSVQRIEFGEVPQAYADALTYFERGDFENAAAKFTLAAGASDARPLVRARARLAAAEAWLRRGTVDRGAIETARKECELFLNEFPTHRDVPRARLLLGRLQRLAGESAKAAETLDSLYREGSGGAPGYAPEIAFQAGLAAGEAYLAIPDAAKSRELYLGLDGAIGTALARLGDADPLRAEFAAIQSEARLGEGFCLLASGSVIQAKTFFQGQIAGADGNPAKSFGARLGLGEALLAEGNARAAQLEFARVSAIDHTSKDRSARALVGLAESAVKLQAKGDAKIWLDAVTDQFPDTPAVLRAQELKKTL